MTKIVKSNVGVNAIIEIPHKDKNIRSRMRKYRQWLDDTGRIFINVDMASYRDFLLESLQPNSALVHLSTIRRRYEMIIQNRQMFYDTIPDSVGSMAEKKAYVDEMITRIENAIKPEHSSVKIVTVQDSADDKHMWLSTHQVGELLSLPDRKTLTGKRDLAIMALFVATGCREGELVASNVKDLRVMFGNEVSFLIPLGKGRKQRLVPYGEMIWLVGLIDVWLQSAGITEGFVFRRIYRGEKRIGGNKLSTFGIQQILKKYPVTHKGEPAIVRPHDLRRTYARATYFAGMEIFQIQLNMGHSNEQTTKRYIGNLGAEKRRPPQIYSSLSNFNL